MSTILNRVIRRLAIVLVIMLAIQFFLGVIAALQVAFPPAPDQVNFWVFTWGHALAIAHMICGTMLVLLCSGLGVAVARTGIASWRRLNIIGSLAVVVAAGSGFAFVATKAVGFSLTMALGFVVAMVAYVQFMSQTQFEETRA